MAACAGVPLRRPTPLRGVVEQRLWQSVRRHQESRRQLRARLHVRPVGVAGWGGESEWEVLARRGGRLLLARRSVLTQPDLVVTADGQRVCVRDPDGCVCHRAPTDSSLQNAHESKAARWLPLAMSPAEISSVLLGVLPVFGVDAVKESDQVDGCELETVTADRRDRLARIQLSCPRGGHGTATVRLSDGALLRYERFDRTGRWRIRVRYEEIQQQDGLPLARRVRLWSRVQGKRVQLIVRLRQAMLNGPEAPLSVFAPTC